MRKILFIFSLLLMFSCSKSNKVWDADKMVSLRPESGVKSETVTAREIVERTSDILFFSKEHQKYLGRGFSHNQRDFENNRLLMWGSDVIDPLHGLVTEFIECSDLVFAEIIDGVITDTLAYIPNATLRSAEAIIKNAYFEEDYNTCYEIFDNAWRFIPISGNEWRALKAAGKN